MSSYAKDARWKLANDLLKDTSLDTVNDLPYQVNEYLMRAAQSVLEVLPQDEIAQLAKMSNDEITKFSDAKYVDMSRLEELEAANHRGQILLSQLELDEILTLAMDGMEARRGAENLTGKKVLKALAKLIKEEM
jgi:hypothetical protein